MPGVGPHINAPFWATGTPNSRNRYFGELSKNGNATFLDLLETAGIVHKVFSSSGQGVPLGAQADPDCFKVLFLDIALSQKNLGLPVEDWIVNPLEQFVNKGAVVEAFVGQEILAYSHARTEHNLYYWQREARGAQAEVDYLWQHQAQVIPIEVKSGPGTTLKSLHMFLESHPQSSYGIKFSTQNYSTHDQPSLKLRRTGKIRSYPLYAVAKLIKKSDE